MRGFKSIFVSSKHKINCFLIQEKYFQTANAVDTLPPEQNKIAKSRPSLLRKEINLGKRIKYGFSELVYYNRGIK